MYQEINFDGLVGPTHNYAGLSEGNRASIAHGNLNSNPRQAALEGLRKMKTLADLGVPQAVLPPLERPSIPWLRRFGISGASDEAVLANAAKTAPKLLVTSASASSMWTANAATVCPSADSADGRVHITPANLSSKLHRAIEARETESVFRNLFPDTDRFLIHSPLAGGEAMRDEGAANHTRLCPSFDSPGMHLFVFGASGFPCSLPRPKRYPARQTIEASQCIARIHRLPEEQTLFLQQAPEAIDAGVFHNDVISVGHCNTFLYHERAFVDGPDAIKRIADQYASLYHSELIAIEVSELEVSLQEAVQTYLFNSQIVTLPGGDFMIVAPSECEESDVTRLLLQRLVDDRETPIRQVHYVPLRESMKNGGGPACLRQRITLNETEIAAINGRLLMNDALHAELRAWINRHYREQLSQADLADPQLLQECRSALDDLTQILQLGSLYPFQKETQCAPASQ